MVESVRYDEDSIRKLCTSWDWPYIWKFNTDRWRGSSIHLLIKHTDAEFLVSLSKGYHDEAIDWSISGEIIDHLSFSTDLRGAFSSQKEYFVRLSSRSPKDLPSIKSPCSSVEDALTRLVQSHRTVNDMLVYLHHRPQLPHLTLELLLFDSNLVDDYIGKPPTDRFEVRCFVYSGKLVAVSHYYSTEAKFVKETEVDSLVDAIRMSIRHPETVQVLNTVDGTAVVDFMIRLDGHSQVSSASFIEINPYGERGGSGPLLFHWVFDKRILEDYGGKVCVRWVDMDNARKCERYVDTSHGVKSTSARLCIML